MSYNQASDYERAQLASEGRQLHEERGRIEQGLRELAAEQQALQAAEAAIADRIARASSSSSGDGASPSLEDRVLGADGRHDGLEELAGNLKGVRARLGQIPAEISTKQSALSQVADRLQALIPRSAGLLQRDTALKDRIASTGYGIQQEAAKLSDQNEGARATLEGVVTAAQGMHDTVAGQVPQDAQLLSWLNSVTEYGSSTSAPGHIDVNAIYGSPAYGEPKYLGIDRVERSLLRPSDTYRGWQSYIPGAEAARKATRTVHGVLDRGAEALGGYIGRALGMGPIAPTYSNKASPLPVDSDFDPSQYYRPLQKVGEIAYDKTKGVARSVVQYANHATAYLTSAIGSLLGRGR